MINWPVNLSVFCSYSACIAFSYLEINMVLNKRIFYYVYYDDLHIIAPC